MEKNILEKSYRQKIEKQSDANLIEIKPGNYMMFSKNKMKRIVENAQGLVLGQRVKGDNVKIVLVDEDLILIPTNST
tara:strand:- start:72 stop:302 length:231 start_codon:yes stop_codon:yes gene_type:complete